MPQRTSGTTGYTMANHADTLTEADFHRLNNDVNGNPRYAVHFIALLTEAELNDYFGNFVARKYAIAVKRANKIGGRRFHNRQFGGGIVFQSYSIPETIAAIVCAVNAAT